MVFLFILLIILILVLLMMTAKLEIKIINLAIDIQTKEHISGTYKVIVKLNIFNKIPITIFTITKNRLREIKKFLKINEKIQKIEKDIWKNKNKLKIQDVNTLKEFIKSVDIKTLNLEMHVGTENAFLTSILVAIFSSIIAIGISKIHVKEDKIVYEIKPIYNSQNFIKIAISGIFQVKVIHIINMIYVFYKKGGKKYERTSNRGSYDYGYE